MAADIDSDRDLVRTLLAAAPARDSSGGDEPPETRRITKAWQDEGRAVELLLPLTQDTEEPSVRFGAASLLVDLGYVDLVAPALGTLTETEPTA